MVESGKMKFSAVKLTALVIFLLAAGCSQAQDFGYGMSRINSVNSKYNATMETYPDSVNDINLMLDKLKELKSLKLSSGQGPFGYIIDYRILNLEAEKLFIDGQKYGGSGTTKDGFGCKQRPLIIESVSLRNSSALKGFEAVELLNMIILKYPEESKSAGLSQKNALFLNATYYRVYEEARKDSGTINSLCKEARVLELYKGEFRKSKILSEDYINNLDYGEAVKIWKESRGIE